MLQRRLNIGYPRAARLLDQLQEMGVVGPAASGGRDREVLLEPDEDENGAEEG
jgi:S-DNA-T family DNA segregation ATPase FtsK/SpoIIIE